MGKFTKEEHKRLLSKKDFYYSKKAHYRRIKIYGKKCRLPKINGFVYTECISCGSEPLTNHFGDLVLVFSGTFTGYKAKYN